MEIKQSLTASALSTVLVLALGMSFPVQAASKTERVAGVDYNVGHTLEQNLEALSGKRVTIHLQSGDTLSGTVKAVSDQLLHLEKLERKDYFDALIRIRDISAIEARFLQPVR